MQLSKTISVIIILIAIYVGFLIFSDIEKTFVTIISVDVINLSLMIFMWILGVIIRIFRWNYFLRKITKLIPFRKSILYYLSGYAFILSPARAGEIIRSPFIKRDYGISISKTAPIVLVERFYDLLAVTAIISVGLFLADFEKVVILLPLGFLVTIFIIIRSKKIFNKILLRLSKIRIVNRIVPNTEESFETIFALMKPKSFFVGSLSSILIGILEVIGIYYLILGLDGKINFNDLLVIFHVSNFAATASMIPGGIGILEGGLVGLLVLYKIKYEVALSIVVLVRLVSTGLFSIIGLVCLQVISNKKN